MGFVLHTRELEKVPPPENPAWMSELVRIKRIGRGFVATGGTCPELGEIVWCDRYTAQGLVTMGKAIMIEGD